MKKRLPLCLLLAFAFVQSSMTPAKNEKALFIQALEDCSFNGIELRGKVQFVEAFPDIKIQYVNAFPDIKVKMVEHFPDDCGEWQTVEHFPDFKVQVVSAFPDIKVQLVEHFPGVD